MVTAASWAGTLHLYTFPSLSTASNTNDWECPRKEAADMSCCSYFTSFRVISYGNCREFRWSKNELWNE